MAYTPITYQARIVQYPRRVRLDETIPGSGIYDLVAVPGTVSQVGTSTSAVNLNHAEQGIKQVTDDLATHKAENVQQFNTVTAEFQKTRIRMYMGV